METSTPTPTVSHRTSAGGGACPEMHTISATLTQLIISRIIVCISHAIISGNWRAAAPKCYHRAHSKVVMICTVAGVDSLNHLSRKGPLKVI